MINFTQNWMNSANHGEIKLSDKKGFELLISTSFNIFICLTKTKINIHPVLKKLSILS